MREGDRDRAGRRVKGCRAEASGPVCSSMLSNNPFPPPFRPLPTAVARATTTTRPPLPSVLSTTGLPPLPTPRHPIFLRFERARTPPLYHFPSPPPPHVTSHRPSPARSPVTSTESCATLAPPSAPCLCFLRSRTRKLRPLRVVLGCQERGLGN